MQNTLLLQNDKLQRPLFNALDAKRFCKLYSFILVLYMSDYNSHSHKERSKNYRQAAYRKAHGRQGSTPSTRGTSRIYTLPLALLAQAQMELPAEATLFQEAAKGADKLDESGLDEWDAGPPYATGMKTDTLVEMRFTLRLVEVMHGRRTRMARERWARWLEIPDFDFEQSFYNAVQNWEEANTFVESYLDGHRERVMAGLWLQWLAREAHSLYTHLNQIDH